MRVEELTDRLHRRCWIEIRLFLLQLAERSQRRRRSGGAFDRVKDFDAVGIRDEPERRVA